jgi:hypothetical protein
MSNGSDPPDLGRDIRRLTVAVCALTETIARYMEQTEHERAILLRVERRLEDTDQLFRDMRSRADTLTGEGSER